MSEQRTFADALYANKQRVTLGQKVHVGTDRRGMIHSVTTTDTATADKLQWGFTKVRYRRLTKNTARVYALCALANLFRLRHRMLPQGT